MYLPGRNSAMQLSSADMERVINLYAPDETRDDLPSAAAHWQRAGDALLGEQILRLIAVLRRNRPPGACFGS